MRWGPGNYEPGTAHRRSETALGATGLRRSGVAAALMDTIEDRARMAGYVQLFLETGDAQPEAQALYAKLSWEPVDDFPEGAFSHPQAMRFTKML